MQKVSHKCHFYSPFFPHPMISEILSIKVTFAWISINSFCWMESHQMSADAENMKKLGAWKSAAIEGMAASRGAVVSGFQRQLLHPPHHHHTTRQTRWPSPPPSCIMCIAWARLSLRGRFTLPYMQVVWGYFWYRQLHLLKGQARHVMPDIELNHISILRNMIVKT